MLRIALAQVNTIVGDLKGNRERMSRYYKKAARLDADLVVFPEMSLCGYPPEDLLFKEHFVRDTLKSLKRFVRAVRRPVAIAGFVDTGRDGRLYNAAAIIAEGKVRAVYHKKVLPNYGVFDEKRYFEEGRSNFIYRLGPYTIGLNICEDIWQKSAVYAPQVKAGAQVLINMSASPYDFGKLKQRHRLLVSRAKETRTYICYVNLVGGQDELIFDGGSLILDPKGRMMANGRQFDEDLVVADLPLKKDKNKARRGTGLRVIRQALKQRNKKELPVRLTEPLSSDEGILKALMLGTRDYVRKNKFQKVVVGLSGGIDSSLVAAIAVEAIGKDNVIGVSMPSRYSSKGTRRDAKILAENLGIRHIVVPIDQVYAAYLRALAGIFSGCQKGVAEENIQARIRGNILMALSNKFGWLVVTTGNKSEIAVGYCTLYGDLSGGFAMIKDVPKTKVYALALLLNQQRGGVIPKSIIRRAPSAELKANQKDQDQLPPYEVLDDLIRAYVEEHRSLRSLRQLSGDPDLVRQVVGLVDRSEYKRRQAPPGIKITPRAFGKDWRLPITNSYKEF